MEWEFAPNPRVTSRRAACKAVHEREKRIAGIFGQFGLLLGRFCRKERRIVQPEFATRTM